VFTKKNIFTIKEGFFPKISAGKLSNNVFTVGLFTSSSKIIGLYREQILSKLIDVGTSDMYYLSMKIPSMVRRITSDGSLENAYIPLLSTFGQDEEASSKWISQVTSIIAIFVLILSFLLLLSTDSFINLMLSGRTAVQKQVFYDFFCLSIPMLSLYSINKTTLFMGAWLSL
jgi:peptidoglycan biosynthesis protein MviN/MurJ (putative lipid II flippase)